MSKKKYDSWYAIANEAVLSKSFLKNPFNVLLTFVKKIEDFTPQMKEELATLMMARISFILEQDKNNRFINLVLQNDCFNFQKNHGEKFIYEGIDKKISLNSGYMLRLDKFSEKRISEINKCLNVLEQLKDTDVLKTISRKDIPFYNNQQKIPISDNMIDVLLRMKDIFNLDVKEWNDIENLVYPAITTGILRQSIFNGSNIKALIRCQEKIFEENVHSYIDSKISNYHILIPKASLYSLYNLNQSKNKNNNELTKVINNAEKGSENKIETTINSSDKTLDINISQLAYLLECSPEDAGKSIVRFNENMANSEEDNKNGFLNLTSFIERFTFDFEMEKFNWKMTIIFKNVENIDISFDETVGLFERELRKCWDKFHKEKVIDYVADGKSIIEKYLMEKDVIMLNSKIDPSSSRTKRVLKF